MENAGQAQDGAEGGERTGRRVGEFSEALDEERVERLVIESLPFVRGQARRLKTRLPAAIDVDDLEGDGLLALVQAARRWDPDHPSGAHFLTFARHYINGAMLGGLRRLRLRPRGSRLPFARLLPLEEAPEHSLADDGAGAGPGSPIPDEFLEPLTPSQRELVCLRYEHGASLAGAGRVLGMPRRNVKAEEVRALRTLRRLV